MYIFTKGQGNPQNDIEHCSEKLFNFNSNADKEDGVPRKPNVLWSAYFSVPDASETDLQEQLPSNVFLCPGPDLDLDYDHTIEQVYYFNNGKIWKEHNIFV